VVLMAGSPAEVLDSDRFRVAVVGGSDVVGEPAVMAENEEA